MNQIDVKQQKHLYLYHSQKIKIILQQMRKRVRDDKHVAHILRDKQTWQRLMWPDYNPSASHFGHSVKHKGF